jgi:hypothetical protein
VRDNKYYDEEYVRKQRSTHDIAKEHSTYPNKIRRELKQYGYELRDRGEAQAAALKNGRHKHPTRGTHLAEDVKEKISKTVTSIKNKDKANAPSVDINTET